MNFASLIGNQRIKHLLKRAVAEGRVGQGLIFAGPRGVGKYRFALALAQAINCLRPIEGDACGECANCRKFAARDFTDVKTIAPDGQFIKIDQMREMSREAYYRPYEGRRRVYLIDGAERLREEAANSILKTLEEPPDTSQIILLTAKPYALLETIRSRCQTLNFAPLAYDELEGYLKANYKRPLEETRLIARLARGSLGRALEIDLGDYRGKRDTLMDLVEALLVRGDTVKVMQAAEYLGRKFDKEAFETHMDLLMTLLEDLFHLKLGEPATSLTNRDIAKRLEQAAEVASLERITGLVEQIEKVLQNLPRNVNRHIAMEAVLLRQ